MSFTTLQRKATQTAFCLPATCVSTKLVHQTNMVYQAIVPTECLSTNLVQQPSIVYQSILLYKTCLISGQPGLPYYVWYFWIVSPPLFLIHWYQTYWAYHTPAVSVSIEQFGRLSTGLMVYQACLIFKVIQLYLVCLISWGYSFLCLSPHMCKSSPLGIGQPLTT